MPFSVKVDIFEHKTLRAFFIVVFLNEFPKVGQRFLFNSTTTKYESSVFPYLRSIYVIVFPVFGNQYTVSLF